jgi:5-methyltetrahydropteroyltriglutamate--homocysteine methyltransferase
VRVRARELWRVPEAWLEMAQDDATRLAISDMERAGIDIITDGEIRCESYSNCFATALAGIDLDNPAEFMGRTGGTVVGPRIVGPIRRLRPVEVHDVEFLRANTDRKIKITLPGPFTMSRQAKNEFYKDEEELVMDYAAAVNAEIRDLKAAGADVIPLDERWLQAPRRGAAPGIAGDRQGTRRDPRADRTASLLWLCLCRARQAKPLRVSARAHRLDGRADLDRSGPTQPRS